MLLLVPPLGEGGKNRARAVANRLKAEQQLIRRAFEDALQRLESVSGFGFLPIGLQIREHISAGKAVGHVLAESPAGSDYRGYSDLSNSTAAHDGPSLADLDISHLVSIEFVPSKGSWAWGPSDGFALAKIQTGEHLFASLVVDMLLDISLFHSWPALVNAHQGQGAREQLSRDQVAFAVSQGYQHTFYGGLPSAGVHYVSFASLVRKTTAFGVSECKAYLQLWYDFLESTILKRPMAGEDRLMPLDAVMAELSQNYHFAGQTNLPKLRRELEALPSGEYLLVRVIKRARGAANRNHLKTLMHGGLPRVGRTRIVRREEVGPFLPYGMYLDFRDVRVDNRKG